MRRPPPDIRFLLTLFPRDEEGEVVVGDLMEGASSADVGERGVALRLHVLASLAAVWGGRVRRGVFRLGGAGLGGEVKAGLRLFRRRPALALAVASSIALGVAATSTGVTFVEGVLHRPLPYPAPEQLVRVFVDLGADGRSSDLSRYGIDALETFDELTSVTAVARVRMVVPGDGGAYRLRGEAVGPGYADLLRPPMLTGRFPDAGDGSGDGPSRIVLSEATWRSRFGAAPDIVGRTIRSDATVHEIVGVAARDFHGTTPEDAIDFWVPLRAWVDHETPEGRARLDDPRDRWLRAVARVRGAPPPRGGRTLGAAPSAAGLPAEATLGVTPLAEDWLAAVRPPLRLLLAAAACLLFLASVNVTALMAARLLERRGELGVRQALGASRVGVVRSLFTEAMALAVAGTAAGCAMAVLLGRPVALLLLSNLTGWVTLPVGLGPRTGPWTVALLAGSALGLALVAALVPLLLLKGGPFNIALERVRGAGVALPTRALNGAQIAVATVLLLGTGLLLRSYDELSRAHPGFRTEGLLRMQITAADGSYPTFESRQTLNREVLAAVRAQTGVRDAVLVGPSAPPFAFLSGTVTLGGDQYAPLVADLHMVTEGFFPVMDIPLVLGRGLEAANTSRGSVVVSRAVAERLGGAQEVLGKSAVLRIDGGDPHSIEIVGVAEDVLYTATADPRPAPLDLYLPLEHWPRTFFSVLADTGERDLDDLVPALRRRLAAVDPSAAIHWVEPMDQVMRTETVGLGRRALLVGILAGLALTMAAIGLYGMLAYSGRRRLGEFALRQALGASPGTVGRMVLVDGLTSVGTGLVAGMATAALFVGVIRGFLYGVTPLDSRTVLGVAAVLAFAGVLAALGPARQAARADVGATLGGGGG